MAHIDTTYHNIIQSILTYGFDYEDPNRKGIRRIQIPDYKFVHNFKDGFPAITTKELYWHGVVGELLWILKGESTIKYLVDNSINIWNKDAYKYYIKSRIKQSFGSCYCGHTTDCDCNNPDMEMFLNGVRQGRWKGNKAVQVGDLGKTYGTHLRGFGGGEDQLLTLIESLKNNPLGTKKTVTFWNPNDRETALTPCHWSFEILVEPIEENNKIKYVVDNFLEEVYTYALQKPIDWNRVEKEFGRIPEYQFTLKWHQHSVDTFLGLPFNIASYALLAHILGKIVNIFPKGIIGDLSNVHIYKPHLKAVKNQLKRSTGKYGSCQLYTPGMYGTELDRLLDIISIEDCQLRNYDSYPTIKAEMLPKD